MRLVIVLMALAASAHAQNAGSCPRQGPKSPTATLRDATPTNSVPPPCQRPQTVSSYLTGDPGVYAWFAVDNLKAGDVTGTQWLTPDGQVYLNTISTGVPSDGNYCLSPHIDIAGTAAATHTGSWTVKLLVNGNAMGTIQFSIASLLIDGAITTNEVKGACSDATPVSFFLTSDPQVIALIRLRGTGTAGNLRFEFYNPANQISFISSGPLTADRSSQCWLGTMKIAGATAATQPGNWHVKISYEGQPVTDLPFVIAPIEVQGLETTDQVPDGCGDPNSVTFFLTSADSQKSWLLYRSGGGGRLRFEYYQPDGTRYQTSSGDTGTDGKVHCQWATLPIAGAPPAGLTGLWTVRTYVDSYYIGTLNFTIAPVDIENPTTTDAVDGCNPPQTRTAFLPSDPQVFTWFLANGVQAGSAPSLDWIAPDGTLFQSTSFDPAGSSGNFCYWGQMSIAGTHAADLTGLWKTNIKWDGAPAASVNFTIAPVHVEQVTTAFGGQGVGCDAPVPANAFLTTDPQAIVWFRVTDAGAGDVAQFDWVGPDGKNYRSSRQSFPDGGTYFVTDTLAIAGQAPAAAPGNWTVSVKWNGQPLFTLPFTISRPAQSSGVELPARRAQASPNRRVLRPHTPQAVAAPQPAVCSGTLPAMTTTDTVHPMPR
jgi:hypothetical protein